MNAARRHPRSLEEVVSSALCTGCGLCASLDPARVDMTVTAQGRMRPRIECRSDKDGVLALDVCPGVHVDGSTVRDRLAPGAPADRVWGHAARLAHGYATDAEVRYRGATAGVLSALSLYLLDEGLVDGVLHVEADAERPLLSTPRVSKDREGVLSGASSRYGPAAPLVQVVQLLDAGRRFAVVGKPCDVAAVRNLGRHDPRVRVQIPYLLTMICEGVPDFDSTAGIVEGFGVREDEVAEISYRGLGWPGPTRVVTRDGRVFEKTYIETWRGTVPYNLQFRCKICPDSVGLQADIVVGDAWLSGEPRAELRDGWSCVIARTSRGEELLARAEREGRLFLEPLTFDQLDEMQPQHVRRRESIVPRLAGMLAAGAGLPRFRHLGLWDLMFHSSPRNSWRNFVGTARRVHAGQTREELVRPGAPCARSTGGER
ncbi:MAG: Coenzyme F420 hydrogenase/dehydrogenase, beta subunit C-terminal domain [Acidimicrobiales bacterium]